MRNYGRAHVTSEYMIFIDDDNTFDEDFAQKIFERWGDREKRENKGNREK